MVCLPIIFIIRGNWKKLRPIFFPLEKGYSSLKMEYMLEALREGRLMVRGNFVM